MSRSPVAICGNRRSGGAIHVPSAFAGLLHESHNRIAPVSPRCMASDSWTPEIGSRLCLGHRPGSHLIPIRYRSVHCDGIQEPNHRDIPSQGGGVLPVVIMITVSPV